MPEQSSSEKLNVFELELFSLIRYLWEAKIFLLFFVSISVFFAYTYAQFAPKQWTATANISVVSASDVYPLNPIALLNSQNELNTVDLLVRKQVNPSDLFSAAIHKFSSVQAFLQFDALREVSIFRSKNSLSEEERVEKAVGFLQENISIQDYSQRSGSKLISLSLGSSVMSAEVLNEYLDFIQAKVLEDFGNEMELFIKRRIQINEIKIEQAHLRYLSRLDEQIAIVEEGLRIAIDSGIKDDKSGVFIDALENRLINANTLYMRGERLLSAELEALRARRHVNRLTSEQLRLHAENDLLRGIKINTDEMSAFVIEKPAIPPSSQDSPNKRLIYLLTVVVSLIVGGSLVLFRRAFLFR